MEPRWLAKARAYVGQREIAGRKNNPLILRWWTLIHAGFTDDETPWCAGFVGGVLEECGIRSSRSAAARSYLTWGRVIKKPIPGCIVVFERGPRNGHVGFLVGSDVHGNVIVLGGNQGDEVSIKTFPLRRVLGFRWPEGEPIPADKLPVVKQEAPESKGEAFATPVDPADEEEGGDEPEGLSARFKHWANLALAGGGSIFASLVDWRVAAVIATAGIIIFLVIWFTQMRRK